MLLGITAYTIPFLNISVLFLKLYTYTKNIYTVLYIYIYIYIYMEHFFKKNTFCSASYIQKKTQYPNIIYKNQSIIKNTNNELTIKTWDILKKILKSRKSGGLNGTGSIISHHILYIKTLCGLLHNTDNSCNEMFCSANNTTKYLEYKFNVKNQPQRERLIICLKNISRCD